MAGSWKQYTVTPEVLAQARRAGLLGGRLEKRIAGMARKSAPFTHPMGNRRYHDCILRIQDDVVVSICRFDPDTGEIITDVFAKLKQA